MKRRRATQVQLPVAADLPTSLVRTMALSLAQVRTQLRASINRRTILSFRRIQTTGAAPISRLTNKITPTIKTININYVPQLSTREIDLKNNAAAGKPFMIDLPGSNLFDVADRNSWLSNNQLVSTIPGVSLYGPHSFFSSNLISFRNE